MLGSLLHRARARLASALDGGAGPGDEDATVLRKVPDDLPRDQLFAEPLVVDRIATPPAERLDAGAVRAGFVVRVRDAQGRRCPDLAVEVTVRGPERTATGFTQTDLLGQATFRMTGPPGTYTLTVDDVAAGALAWDRATSTLTATTEAAAEA